MIFPFGVTQSETIIAQVKTENIQLRDLSG